MANDTNDQKELLKLIQEAIKQDELLREKFEIGEKFRFIRDRLQALYNSTEESLRELEQEENKQGNVLAEDEIAVYVYLYNAQGMVLQTWQKMVSPSVFYEYSINRPIYSDKANIEAFIRAKPNRQQHAYLTIAVKKTSLLPNENIKDPLGHPLIKVKEGGLLFDRFIDFHHNNHEYILDASGVLTKKPSSNA